MRAARAQPANAGFAPSIVGTPVAAITMASVV
jgi:hypothetical protein